MKIDHNEQRDMALRVKEYDKIHTRRSYCNNFSANTLRASTEMMATRLLQARAEVASILFS